MTGSVAGAVLAALALLAKEESPQAPRGSPAPTVEVRLSEDAPVLGIDQGVEVRIKVSPAGPVGARVPMPRLFVLGGRIEELVRTAPGELTGRLVLTSERYPQVAMVVAELPGEPTAARGFAFARLQAATSPAFHTDPGAMVTLRIADRDYGPQKAPRNGMVRIPVVVPPGVTFALARSVNAFGKATEETVDLRVPSFPRVLIVAPETFVAGGVAEIAVYAVEPSGAPAATGAIMLKSSGERAQPLGGRPGEARFLLRVPTSVAAGTLRLEAALRGEPATKMVADVPLVAARPAKVMLRPDRSRLTIGAGSAMRVYLSAQDAFGNATDAGDTLVLVDGTRVLTRAAADGRTMAIVPAPSVYAGRDHVDIEAATGSGYARHRVPLANVPARGRHPRVWTGRDPALSVTPRLGVLWNARQALGPTLLIEALVRRSDWPPGLSLGLATGYLHSGVRVAGAAGLSRARISQVPVLLIGRFRRRLLPRLSFSAGVGLGLTIARTRVQSFTYEVGGSDVAPAGELSTDAALALGAGELVMGARYLLAPLGRVSSGDTIAGNSAGGVVDVGYRMLW